MRVAVLVPYVCGRTDMCAGGRDRYQLRQGQSCSPQSVTVHNSSSFILTNAHTEFVYGVNVLTVRIVICTDNACHNMY